jgi:hypothetical protein
MNELGYSEGKNLLVQWCYAHGNTVASVDHSRLAAQTRVVQG